MKRYLKRAVQVMVLTAVLVFAGMLIANTGFVAQDALANGHESYDGHTPKRYPDGFRYYAKTQYR